MIPPPEMYPLDTTSEIFEDIFTWAFNIPLYIIANDNKKYLNIHSLNVAYTQEWTISPHCIMSIWNYFKLYENLSEINYLVKEKLKKKKNVGDEVLRRQAAPVNI